MKFKPIKLQPEYREVLNELNDGSEHYFITGKAGTGKSTLLRWFVRTQKQANIIVLAPTGVAALNAGGQTIHSFFGFPPKLMNASDIKKRRYRKLYKQLDIIIIDEISMVRADMMDHIDRFLRINRENALPFGGVRLLMFGDLYQIPPVVTAEVQQFLSLYEYETPYFFSAKVFTDHKVSFRTIFLETVFRQEEMAFVQLLDKIRVNSLDYDDLEYLNQQNLPVPASQTGYIHLSPRNATVERINSERLQVLPGNIFMYQAKVDGEFHPKLFPTDLHLKLKKGAQVMFLRNDPDGKYVNGTIGRVVDLDYDYVAVEIGEEDKTSVIGLEMQEWEILKYKINEKNKIESEMVGSFSQYPLRLAWAITIHKSQGKTFDRVILDFGKGSFAPGQTYVALSRCRTLGGIILSRPIRINDIIVDQRVVEFYDHLNRF